MIRAAALALLLVAAPATAQRHGGGAIPLPGDDLTVLKTVDAVFAAIEAKDPKALLAVTLLEGSATATYVSDAGMPMVTTSDWAAFAQRLTRIPGKAIERNLKPEVRVEGDIAMVWSPYVFTIDGKVVHCGTNHFDLIRKDDQWRVLNATWTQRKTGCPAK